MFIVNYFKWGFDFPKLLNRRNLSLAKTLIYFLLLTFIANFPLTWLAFEYEGSKINFIEENLTSSIPNWSDLPNGTIHLGGFTDVELNGRVYQHLNYIYMFGYNDSIIHTPNVHFVIFESDYIRYIDDKGNELISNGYSGFETVMHLSEINLSTGIERMELFTQFGNSIENSFSQYIILYTVVRNQAVQIGATFIFILLLSLIIQLFRFGFQNFLSYKDGLNYVILSSTLPSILSLIFGLILPGFAPVVFNLVLGLVVMLVLLVFSRKSFS